MFAMSQFDLMSFVWMRQTDDILGCLMLVDHYIGLDLWYTTVALGYNVLLVYEQLMTSMLHSYHLMIMECYLQENVLAMRHHDIYLEHDIC
jgi:hypothetical protein